jgi:hypothetical protein
MPSSQARAIGEVKSIGIIGKKGRNVKVKSLSLRGGKILRGSGKNKGKSGGIFWGGRRRLDKGNNRLEHFSCLL